MTKYGRKRSDGCRNATSSGVRVQFPQNWRVTGANTAENNRIRFHRRDLNALDSSKSIAAGYIR
jgi:hypothetical protein